MDYLCLPVKVGDPDAGSFDRTTPAPSIWLAANGNLEAVTGILPHLSFVAGRQILASGAGIPARCAASDDVIQHWPLAHA